MRSLALRSRRILPFVVAASAGPLLALACANNSSQCFADDLPDSNNEDSNCDGIDGNKASAIFVATTGSDLAAGTMEAPLRTLGAAIAMAQKNTAKTQILIGFGDYQEPSTVALLDGVGIFGGYDPDNQWSRTTTKPTTIHGAPVALTARGFKLSTTLGRITVDAEDGAQPSESSIALVAIDVAAMTLEDTCILQAGKAAGGAPGADADDGAGGTSGQAGGNGNVDDENAPGLGGPPGTNLACPDANGGAGGKGGSNSAYTGGNGNDSPAGVAGGIGGDSGGGCSGHNGGDGATGANDGASGTDGTGGASSGTFDDQTYVYVPADGVPGDPGQDGAGGGGGGGSAGQTGTLCNDGAGNGGGGGGAGGCGGGSGVSGHGGGASIALVAIRSPLTLQHVQLITLGGGSGGSGGTGGAGGTPGVGGPQNSNGTSEIGTSGKGGDGRAGGRGGAGGGGGGGPSFGVWVTGASPTITDVVYTLGPGGVGGGSSGAGGAGQAGASKQLGP